MQKNISPDVLDLIAARLDPKSRLAISSLNRHTRDQNAEMRKAMIKAGIIAGVRTGPGYRDAWAKLRNMVDSKLNLHVDNELGIRNFKVFRFGGSICERMRNGMCIVQHCPCKTPRLYCDAHAKSYVCKYSSCSARPFYSEYCNDHEFACHDERCVSGGGGKTHCVPNQCNVCKEPTIDDKHYCEDHHKVCAVSGCNTRCNTKSGLKKLAYCSEHYYRCRRQECSVRHAKDNWCDAHYPPMCVGQKCTGQNARYFFKPGVYHSFPAHENVEIGYCIACRPEKWTPLITTLSDGTTWSSSTRYTKEYE